MMDFVAWPKIPRLHKDIVVTEKIDGTNAAVIIEAIPNPRPDLEVARRASLRTFLGKPGEGAYEALWFERGKGADSQLIAVGAQSRTRLITPEADNFGFARWVFENAEALYDVLGTGRHYGEWWGSGIQRGYGLPKGEKRFSLFNVARYGPVIDGRLLATEPNPLIDSRQLTVVPTLYHGPFSEKGIEDAMQSLDDHGSLAAPGFKPPEGVVVFHEAAQQVFKWTFEDAPKGNSSLTAAEAATLAAHSTTITPGLDPLRGFTRTNGEWRA